MMRGKWFVATDGVYIQELGICSRKLNPVANVDRMNYIVCCRVVCWLAETLCKTKQFYKCCTSQLLSGLQNLLLILKITLHCSVLKHNLASQLQLLGRKTSDKKILVNLLQFAKFTPSKILYHMVVLLFTTCSSLKIYS